MECITWFAPILPGKLDEWKSLIQEMNGPRMEEYRKSRERMGLTREVVSHMETPQGDFVALFQEGEDVSKAFQALAASNEPYDEWFKEKISEIHGITPEMLQAPLPARVILDYKAG
jgi:DNA polymerase III epsilon subunit-like protein